MTAKGGVISFRVGASQMADIRDRAKAMPRKANGRAASSGDVVHSIVREALQRMPNSKPATLKEVLMALDPDWSGNKPMAPKPVKLDLTGGKSPVDLYLDRQR